MWASTLLKRGFLTTLLLGTFFQRHAAQQFPNSSIDASYPGLTSGCAVAIDPVINCDDVLADMSLSFVYLPNERLTSLCTTGCSNSLRLARQGVAKACTAQTDVISDGKVRYPVTYVLDRLLWAYTATCRKDATSGAFCHATLRDWAMENSAELTKDQQCSDCMLGVTQAELSSPFGYNDAHFQEVVRKVHAHAADNVRYSYPEPYNQRIIDTLRFEPVRYMPNASLDDVCQHFRLNYVPGCDPEKTHEPGPQDNIIDAEKCGPNWDWCIFIDDEVLESLEKAPEPIRDTPPEGARPSRLAYNAYNAFVKLLSADYTTMQKPIPLTAKSRQGTGGTQWNGWFKFLPPTLRRVFHETNEGNVEVFFRRENKPISF